MWRSLLGPGNGRRDQHDRLSHTDRGNQVVARGLGEHLQTWRKLNGIAQALAAERAGISVATLRAIEQGESASTETCYA